MISGQDMTRLDNADKSSDTHTHTKPSSVLNLYHALPPELQLYTCHLLTREPSNPSNQLIDILASQMTLPSQ